MPTGTPHDVAELAMTLAEEHGLFAFDPQIGEVLTAPNRLYSDASIDDVPGVGTVVVVIALPLVLLVSGVYWLFL